MSHVSLTVYAYERNSTTKAGNGAGSGLERGWQDESSASGRDAHGAAADDDASNDDKERTTDGRMQSVNLAHRATTAHRAPSTGARKAKATAERGLGLSTQRRAVNGGKNGGVAMRAGAFYDAAGEMSAEQRDIVNAVNASMDVRAGPVVPRSEAGDPFGMLLRNRIVFLGHQVDDFNADAVISQLLLLDQQDPTKEIKLFINSPGGSVTAGMGIYDAMQFCRAPVSTVCLGLAASMGAFLLAAGEKGRRMSMPNARIMIHQPLGGAQGSAVDIEIQAKEIMHHKANLNRLMAFHTGQNVEKIDADTDRDRYMSPLEAKNYGVIDIVIGGDDAGLKIEGSTSEKLKTKKDYVAWGNESYDGSSSSRFTGETAERKV